MRSVQVFAIVWTALFWGLGIAIPLCMILVFPFHHQDVLLYLLDPVVLGVARSTFEQAFWSTAISGSMGLCLGLQLGSYLQIQPRSRIPFLFSIPFGVPTIVVATAWVGCLGQAGVLQQMGIHLNWIYSLKAVIGAHVFLNAPWIALFVAEARKNIPDVQIEAARSLGASRWGEFVFVLWPQLKWVWASACVQVLALCAMSFALILILGGGPPVQTLESEIYAQMRFGTLHFSAAIACTFWQWIITLVPWLMVLWLRSNGHRGCSVQAKKAFESHSKNRRSNRWMAWVLVGFGVLFLLPYFSVLNFSVWRFLGQLLWDVDERTLMSAPFRISLLLAVMCSGVTVLTAIFGILSLQGLKKWPKAMAGVAALLNLPSGLSIFVLGMGVWLAYERWVDPFEGSFLVILGLQSVIFLPTAFRVLWPLALTKPSSAQEAAWTLGAPSFYAFWTVEFPRWKGPLFAVFSGIAGASLGEVGAASFFYNENWVPLPLLISQWMQQYRFEQAQGLAGFLFLLSLLLMVSSLEVGNRIR